MSKAKAMLDALMGPSRDLSKKDKTGEDFKADNVCKAHLVGFCPQEYLHQVVIDQADITTSRPKKCKMLHSVALVAELEKHAKADHYKVEYTKLLVQRLLDINTEVERRVASESRYCQTKTASGQMPPSMIQKKAAYEKEKQRLLKLAEGLAVPTARVATAKEAQRCADEIDAIEVCVNLGYPGEKVCKACGVRMLVGSASKFEFLKRFNMIWEDDHLQTDCHQGFVTLHEKFVELKESLPKLIEDLESKPAKAENKEKGERDRSRRRSNSRGRNGKASNNRKERSADSRSRERPRGDRGDRRDGGDRGGRGDGGDRGDRRDNTSRRRDRTRSRSRRR